MPRIKKDTDPEITFVRVRLTKELRERVEKYALRNASNMSTVIAMIVSKYINQFTGEVEKK